MRRFIRLKFFSVTFIKVNVKLFLRCTFGNNLNWIRQSPPLNIGTYVHNLFFLPTFSYLFVDRDIKKKKNKITKHKPLRPKYINNLSEVKKTLTTYNVL